MIIAAVTLGVLIVASAVLLLPACGLVSGFSFARINACPLPVQVNATMDDARTRQMWLEDHLARLSWQLRERVCEPVPASTVEEVVVLLEPPAPRPERPSTASEPQEIGGVDWSTERTSQLAGCWKVIHALSYLSSWRICFDAEGNGHQVLVYDIGLQCEVRATTWFDAGRFVIRDNERWQCEDGRTDFPHEAICDLAPDGPTDCIARHLGHPGEHRFDLRR